MAEADSRIILEEGSGYYEEKRSRFLAAAFPVHSEEEAMERISAIRKKYYDARHTCYAFVTGSRQAVMRFSDDGEPGGTAGRPILDVILGRGLSDVCIAVTRYFGGTLLGTGGLVRAYGSAAKDALEHAAVLEVYEGEEWTLLCDYSLLGKVDYEARQRDYARGETVFGADPEVRFYLTAEEVPAFVSSMTELSQGEAILTCERKIRFGRQGDKVCILP